jgi:hypothetical protein
MPSSFLLDYRQRQVNIFRQWEWEYFCARRYRYSVGGCQPIVLNKHPNFELPSGISVLRNIPARYNGEISSHLALPEFPLIRGHFGDPIRNAFHGASRAHCFANRCLHVPFLVAGDCSREINGIPKVFRLYVKHYSLNDESKKLQYSDKTQGSSEPHQPPVGGRFILSILLLLGAFFCRFVGRQYLYNDRVSLAATVLWSTTLLSSAAFGLW